MFRSILRWWRGDHGPRRTAGSIEPWCWDPVAWQDRLDFAWLGRDPAGRWGLFFSEAVCLPPGLRQRVSRQIYQAWTEGILSMEHGFPWQEAPESPAWARLEARRGLWVFQEHPMHGGYRLLAWPKAEPDWNALAAKLCLPEPVQVQCRFDESRGDPVPWSQILPETFGSASPMSPTPIFSGAVEGFFAVDGALREVVVPAMDDRSWQRWREGLKRLGGPDLATIDAPFPATADDPILSLELRWGDLVLLEHRLDPQRLHLDIEPRLVREGNFPQFLQCLQWISDTTVRPAYLIPEGRENLVVHSVWPRRH